MTCDLYSSLEAAKEAMEKLSTETKECFDRQTELISKAFMRDEKTAKTKPEIKAIVVHHFLKNDTYYNIKDLEKDKKMKAKLTLDDGREIEIELTEEQEKAIKGDDFLKDGDVYWSIDAKGDITYNCYYASCGGDYRRVAIGNYFKTEQEAEDMIRALKLIENVRRDRKELNGDWKPDWNDYFQKKWEIIYSKRYNNLNSYPSSKLQEADILGWYKSEEIAYRIINKYKAELTWFFEEFLQERN